MTRNSPATVADFARANGIDPKRMRAKLRRALRAKTLKTDHVHRQPWKVDAKVMGFMRAQVGKSAPKAKRTKRDATPAAE